MLHDMEYVDHCIWIANLFLDLLNKHKTTAIGLMWNEVKGIEN